MYLLEPVIDLSITELFTQILDFISYPPVLIPGTLLAIVGIAGQWSLYRKCDLNGLACIIPVWNVLEFLKIMGRPASHGIIVMAPPPIIMYLLLVGPLGETANIALSAAFGLIWIGFMVKIYIELCQAFGQCKPFNYIMCILFNGFYVLYLGISGDTEYEGPVYGQSPQAS